MPTEPKPAANVKQAVPFFNVTDIDGSYWRDGQRGGAPDGPLGQGVSICFMCADALAIYKDLVSRGVTAQRPYVGNGLWVTSLTDPDGYRLDFESPTEVAEDTVYSG